MSDLYKKLPGAALAVGIAVLAYFLQVAEMRLLGYAIIEALVIAILLGMLLRNTRGVSAAQSPGVAFMAKDALEFAVMLLGASVNFPEIFSRGPALFAAIVLLVAVALGASLAAGRMLGLNAKLATLVAVGNSICGNSAIAAVAPVIKAEPGDVASAIAFTAVLGVGVVLTLPLLIPLLGYSEYQYGVLAGMSIYAVPQVVAAAAQVSDLSLKVATSVKLVRVLLLGPVVLLYALLEGRRGVAGEVRFSVGKFVPWFIAGFLVLATLRSIGIISASVGEWLAFAGKMLTIASMAALGLGVDFRAIQKAGPRVILAVLASLAVLIVSSVLLIRAFGITG